LLACRGREGERERGRGREGERERGREGERERPAVDTCHGREEEGGAFLV
jgi:hypothetical protein